MADVSHITFKLKKNEIFLYSKYTNNKNKIITYQRIKMELYNKTNIILYFFIFIFLLLPRKIFSSYIEIKVNQEGENQIISSEYTGTLPRYYSYDGANQQVLNNQYNFSFTSTEKKLKLYWSTGDGYLNNFANMFKGLTSITEVHLEHMLEPENENTFSYMFSDCISLTKFSCNINDNDRPSIKDTRGMFYNCVSLESFKFDELFASFDIYSSSPYTNYNFYKEVNMSQMFYNCQKLQSINIGSKSYAYINDMREMFYNCISLTTIDLKNFYADSHLNLSYMFYNCENIENILLDFSTKNIYPNDISFMFYNCHSLISLTINGLKTQYTKNMNYMLYNCKSLTDLNFINTYFSNSETIYMRGVFQNCESLTTLDLSDFYTPKVQIMWDMFKGCSSLQKLKIPNFDTSKVTDMQSMFNGCSSLISLDLSSFKTSNVQYMNKMFKDCINLKSIYFNKITSESLGTMHRMFYNCSSLIYLNIFSLSEDIQSLTEILEGTPDNIQLCIKNEKNIPIIFDIIYNKTSATRDCSYNCYHDINNNRSYAEKTKQCCPKRLYDGLCYDKCPGRTNNTSGDKECFNFSCQYYYNYEQNGCLPNKTIPKGYYINDTNLKTIDKCDSNCKTCIKRAKKCLTCNNDKPYLYLNTCLSSCEFGSYTEEDTNIKKCYCYEEKCKICSEESMQYNLCETCNEENGYYQKFNETFNNGFVNCYKAPEEYYFDSRSSIYKPCYPSCKYCGKKGNKRNHYCLSCNEKNTNQIQMEDSDNDNYTNCYPNCTFNFYFDDNYNYICLNRTGCPTFSPLTINKAKQCVKECDDKNRYKFRSTCFDECPLESKNISNNTGFYCTSVCSFEKPFELVQEQLCVSSCTIMERLYGLCVTNYEGNRTLEIQNKVLLDIKYDINSGFNYSIITKNRNIVYQEKNIIYEITSTQCEYHDPRTSTIKLGECESLLKTFYDIDKNEPLYILKIDAHLEDINIPKVEYEIYYHFNEMILKQLDLSICEGKEIIIGYPMDISSENLDIYDKNSGFYNDICYTYTNENGTDLTLEDRQIDYVEKNRSLCEENCDFGSYDKITGSVECICDVKLSGTLISELKFDKNKLYQFMDISKIANFNVMKCIKLLFSKKGIITNIGFYSFFPVIIVYLVSIIVFNIYNGSFLSIS